MKALPETSGEESIEMHGMACALDAVCSQCPYLKDR
jgi:hypothetical protein